MSVLKNLTKGLAAAAVGVAAYATSAMADPVTIRVQSDL